VRPASEVTLNAVEATVSGGAVVVTLTATGEPEIRTLELKAPDRIVLDLRNAAVGSVRPFGERSVEQLGVKKVRWAPFASDAPTVRVVVDLERPMKYSLSSQPGLIRVSVQP
jgi:hypothetical protein